MYSAAILAGGRATRFGGRDKGALLVEGRTIRDRQLAALLAITDDLLLVGADATAGVHHHGELRLVNDIVSDPAKARRMGEAAHSLATPEATKRIVDTIEEII